MIKNFSMSGLIRKDWKWTGETDEREIKFLVSILNILHQNHHQIANSWFVMSNQRIYGQAIKIIFNFSWKTLFYFLFFFLHLHFNSHLQLNFTYWSDKFRTWQSNSNSWIFSGLVSNFWFDQTINLNFEISYSWNKKCMKFKEKVEKLIFNDTSWRIHN